MYFLQIRLAEYNTKKVVFVGFFEHLLWKQNIITVSTFILYQELFIFGGNFVVGTSVEHSPRFKKQKQL
jgi:hypothetical protein